MEIGVWRFYFGVAQRLTGADKLYTAIYYESNIEMHVIA